MDSIRFVSSTGLIASVSQETLFLLLESYCLSYLAQISNDAFAVDLSQYLYSLRPKDWRAVIVQALIHSEAAGRFLEERFDLKNTFFPIHGLSWGLISTLLIRENYGYAKFLVDLLPIDKRDHYTFLFYRCIVTYFLFRSHDEVKAEKMMAKLVNVGLVLGEKSMRSMLEKWFEDIQDKPDEGVKQTARRLTMTFALLNK